MGVADAGPGSGNNNGLRPVAGGWGIAPGPGKGAHGPGGGGSGFGMGGPTFGGGADGRGGT